MKFGFVIILITIIGFGCSSPNEHDNNEVLITSGEQKLSISNKTSEKIYYFTVEESVAAVINWAPRFDGPSIESGKLNSINYSEIFNRENQQVKVGDKVIIYWWKKTDISEIEVISEKTTLK